MFLPDTVILETAWVLRHAYGFDRLAIVNAFRKLMGLSNVRVQAPRLLSQVFDWTKQGLDFADVFHLAHSQSADALYAFGKDFSKRGGEISNCPVREL